MMKTAGFAVPSEILDKISFTHNSKTMAPFTLIGLLIILFLRSHWKFVVPFSSFFLELVKTINVFVSWIAQFLNYEEKFWQIVNWHFINFFTLIFSPLKLPQDFKIIKYLSYCNSLWRKSNEMLNQFNQVLWWK